MNQLAGKQLFSAFDDSGTVKHGLPSEAYTEGDFYDLEAGQIFSKNWSFVGFAHDLSNVGDVMPIRVAKQSLFLVRSEKDKIRAFYNVCLHRNLKLVDKSHNCKNLITCPYHNWCYDFEGKLRATPFFGGEKTELPEEFSLEDHGLHEVTCRLFHDWIFVNLVSETPTFDSHIAPLKKQLADFNLNEYFVVSSIEFGEIKTNWKLLMENFIEPYHVQFVHKNTTNQPLVDHYVVSDGHCLGSAVDIKQEQTKEGVLSVSSKYLTLFPNFVLGVYYPDQIGVHLNIPVSSEYTCQRRVIYLHKDSDQSVEAVEKISRLWDSVHKEDHAMCERLQEGRHSEVAQQGGFLSPFWESSVREFQELVADYIRPALRH